MDDVKAVHRKNRVAGNVGIGVWSAVDFKSSRIPGIDIGAEVGCLNADVPDTIFSVGDCYR